ncbi:MAG TPA: hypothetical protein DDW49_03205 [Deltaproteobacteria bacterium]|nr:hypothetical protein [Deltaproteobacteria bacterium]
MARRRGPFPGDLLPISINHIEAVKKLPLHHRDPFDRMLIAQAHSEQLILVTRDQEMLKYKVSHIQA